MSPRKARISFTVVGIWVPSASKQIWSSLSFLALLCSVYKFVCATRSWTTSSVKHSAKKSGGETSVDLFLHPKVGRNGGTFTANSLCDQTKLWLFVVFPHDQCHHHLELENPKNLPPPEDFTVKIHLKFRETNYFRRIKRNWKYKTLEQFYKVN